MMMRTAMTLFAVLLASTAAKAQYAAIYADPYSSGRVQIVTDLNDWGNYSDGASFTMATPGEIVYFSFEPETNYEFDRIAYEGISEDDVTSLPGGIYYFTMPEVDANSFVNIRVYFKKITVVVTGTNINEENFPDEHFRNWLLSQSYGKDAVITDTEMAGITKISARACGIEDLTGIELFTELTELDLSNLAGTHPEESWNKISTIDLGSNTKLRKLYINNNQLSSIDISNNSNLRIIDVSNNLLTELDVSDNPNLESLTCNGNLLTGLDVTGNPNLEILSCSENQLSVLDISQNPLMNQLFCDNNSLTGITGLPNHDKMIIFNCYNNQLTSLDVSGCTELFQLYCYNNKIKGEAMTSFVNSLETPPNGGYMVIIDLESEIEENEMTDEQVAAAKAKSWSVEALLGEDFVPYPYNPDDHQYVDLGLTSGTLWATCNVGAVQPYQSGLFFAWGDTEGHGSDTSDGYLFNWENYKWGEVIGEDTYFTKYCTDSNRGKDGFTDGKYELDPEDDAAYVNWGPQWRMPTKEQFDELQNECTWTPMTIGDVNGYEVEGPNGNTIFLPETGWRIDDMLLDGGAYWTRSANSESTGVGGAYYLGWDNWGWYEYGGRLDGQCVRPVFKKNEVIELADDADNDETIEAAVESGNMYDVKLSGRTLYKDGTWNTLCLPFGVTASQLAESTNPLYGAEIRTLSSSSLSNGTLTLNFTPATGEGSVTEITAGIPYIIKWAVADDYVNDDEHNIVSPVFNSVTFTTATPDNVETDAVDFTGFYSPLSILEQDNKMLYMGADNKLYYPNDAMTINAFRAVFNLKGDLTCAEPKNDAGGINNFVLNFGENATDIRQISGLSDGASKSDLWFTTDGRKLIGKPTAKGIYINNGQKVVIR